MVNYIIKSDNGIVGNIEFNIMFVTYIERK